MSVSNRRKNRGIHQTMEEETEKINYSQKQVTSGLRIHLVTLIPKKRSKEIKSEKMDAIE